MKLIVRTTEAVYEIQDNPYKIKRNFYFPWGKRTAIIDCENFKHFITVLLYGLEGKILEIEEVKE